MTENEALFRIKDLEYECMNSTIHYFTDKDIPMLHIAIKALEEIQQYRAIGTVEELKALKVENEELHCEIQAINATMDLLENEIRAKAIDEFVHKVKEHQYVLSDVINSKDYGMFTIGIEQIAEQLKAGGENVQKK